MKLILYSIIGGMFILSACSAADLQPPADEPNMDEPTSSEDTPAPIPPEENTGGLRQNVYFDSVELLTMESYPLQFSFVVKGNLPTPCHQLATNIHPADAENKIVVEIYSTSDPEMMCAQVLQPFEQSFPLGSFAPGHYTLWINGELFAEFDA